jgi:photosystem II stability/assembly factor-like uncharacterized protein
MSFLDRQDGFILRFGGAAAGSAVYSVYRTRDGGATWSKIAYKTFEPNQPSRGGLPTCDCLGGISFRDRAVGWITGTPLAVAKQLMFERTSDGGVTWYPQALPLPDGFQQFEVSTAPPAFFGSVGVLPVAFARPQAFVLYVSRDGGRSWQPTSPIRERARSSLYSADAFALDAAHFWSWVDQTLYQTSDAGNHWHPLARRLPVRGIPELQFLTPRFGYMLNDNLGGLGGSSYLLTTTDGGSTWRKVQTLLLGGSRRL